MAKAITKNNQTVVYSNPTGKIAKCKKIQMICLTIFALTLMIALIWGGLFGFYLDTPTAREAEVVRGWQGIYSAFVIEVVIMWPVYFAAIGLLLLTTIIRIITAIKLKKNPPQPKRITDIYKGYRK